MLELTQKKNKWKVRGLYLERGIFDTENLEEWEMQRSRM